MPTSDHPACAFDGEPFEVRDRAVACDKCRATVHEECWAQQRKCPTEGCKGKPLPIMLLQRTVEVQGAPSEIGPETKEALTETEARLDRAILKVQKNLFDTLTTIRNQLTTALNDQQNRYERLSARVTEVITRLRALDHGISRRHQDGLLPRDPSHAPTGANTPPRP